MAKQTLIVFGIALIVIIPLFAILLTGGLATGGGSGFQSKEVSCDVEVRNPPLGIDASIVSHECQTQTKVFCSNPFAAVPLGLIDSGHKLVLNADGQSFPKSISVLGIQGSKEFEISGCVSEDTTSGEIELLRDGQIEDSEDISI